VPSNPSPLLPPIAIYLQWSDEGLPESRKAWTGLPLWRCPADGDRRFRV